jgi:hypothetical protein
MNQPKTSKAEATARPWRLTEGKDGRIFIHVSEKCDDMTTIAEMQEAPFGQVDSQGASDAALIVKSVNEHDALCAVAEATRMAWSLGQIVGGSKLAVDTALSALAALRAKDGK